MNLSISKHGVICFLAFNLLLSPYVYTQSLDDIRIYADDQFKKGDYHIAISEYHRYLFFSGIMDFKILERIGDCLNYQSDYSQASNYYDRAYFFAPNDSSKSMLMLKKSRCQVLYGDFEMALAGLLGIDSINCKTYYLTEFYKGICYFALDNYPQASLSFQNSVPVGYHNIKCTIDSLFHTTDFRKPKSGVARTLSSIIPGLGQLYAGDYKNSLNSLLLNSAIVFIGFRVAIQMSILDAIFMTIPWYQRYFQGGIMRAGKIATEKRKQKKDIAYRQIIRLIKSTGQDYIRNNGNIADNNMNPTLSVSLLLQP